MSDLSIAVQRTGKVSTMSCSVNIMPGLFESSDSGAHSYKSNHFLYKTIGGVVSLSIFRGNFVLAKVSLGLISVRCTELRGVCFSEVRNVLVLW